MEQKRIGYLDTCKGILIILVVIGHGLEMRTDYGPVYAWIYSFHLPAFLILSGAMFHAQKWEQRGFRSFLISRIQSILIPYLFFELLCILFKFFCFDWGSLNLQGRMMEALRALPKMIPLHTLSNVGANWYLATLFFAELLLFAILRGGSRRKTLASAAILFAVSAASSLLHRSFGGTGLLLVFRISLAALFLLIGSEAREFLLEQRSPLWILAALAVTVLSVFGNRAAVMAYGAIRSVALFLLSGFAGAVLVLDSSRRVDNPILQKIGANSLIIMGTHQLVKYLILNRWPVLWNWSLPHFALDLIGVAALEALLIPLTTRFVPFLVGKQRIPITPIQTRLPHK